ncbi:MAG: hypothetical protein GKR87_14680 [Kiritimatiellae bacterium]|nr:hypothetical protein [Kiritimatiellia bacterium]
MVGAGVMGGGIAQWVSARKLNVVLRDIDEEKVLGGMATASKLYQVGVKRRLFSQTEAARGLDRIFPSASEVSLKRVGIVIEAAVENMEIKKQIFDQLEKLADDDTILATNTSALSISEIAKSTQYPERVIGIHFFNPVHRMPLVEIVVGQKTSKEVISRVVQFVQKIGKLPVVVKDSPGFVVNRILMPYLVEAGILFEQTGHVRDMDESMLDFGMPMGPLRLIDQVGVDVSQHVASFLKKQYGDRIPSPTILQKMIEKGYIGQKSGKGFYTYKKKRQDIEINNELVLWSDAKGETEATPVEWQQRMVLLMVNEAARCLEEKVAETSEDIDFAMIMGTGFAPFRGGPLRYADSVGISEIVDQLVGLAEKIHSRFAPCNLLKTMAIEKRTFYESRK